MQFNQALSYLIVAILSPIVVSVVSNNIAKFQEPKENLVFQELSPVNFELNTQKTSFRSVVVSNLGTISSKNVRIVIQYQNNVKVQCGKPEFSIGDAADSIPLKITQPGIGFLIPSLTPKEKVTISCLSEGEVDKNPEISIKSDNITGQENNIFLKSTSTAQDDVYGSIVLFLVILLILLFYFAIWINSINETTRFLNGTAAKTSDRPALQYSLGNLRY
jgi:hypothetical protein